MSKELVELDLSFMSLILLFALTVPSLYVHGATVSTPDPSSQQPSCLLEDLSFMRSYDTPGIASEDSYAPEGTVVNASCPSNVTVPEHDLQLRFLCIHGMWIEFGNVSQRCAVGALKQLGMLISAAPSEWCCSRVDVLMLTASSVAALLLLIGFCASKMVARHRQERNVRSAYMRSVFEDDCWSDEDCRWEMIPMTAARLRDGAAAPPSGALEGTQQTTCFAHSAGHGHGTSRPAAMRFKAAQGGGGDGDAEAFA